MSKFKEGDIVLLNTSGQAGTLSAYLTPDFVAVILRCGDLWYGNPASLRIPQSAEELAAAPITVEKIVPRQKKSRD